MFASRSMMLLCCFVSVSLLAVQRVSAASSVGCLFSPDVCDKEEDCFDDNAFGICMVSYNAEDPSYRHQLGSETLGLLEREFTRLFAGGYRWRHEYTQCVVQNILYSSRRRISYDPGLCAREMHLTLPDVPPDVLADIESPKPDDLAYIKFKPTRDDPKNEMYAAEVFNPSEVEVKEAEKKSQSKKAKKRSANAVEGSKEDWLKSLYAENLKSHEVKPAKADQESLFRKLLEVAEDTEQLLEKYKTKAARYPEDDIQVVQNNYPSNPDRHPIFSEAGTQWVPDYDSDEDYVLGNDIIDPYEKKTVPAARESAFDGNGNYPSKQGVKYFRHQDPPPESTFRRHDGNDLPGEGEFLAVDDRPFSTANHRPAEGRLGRNGIRHVVDEFPGVVVLGPNGAVPYTVERDDYSAEDVDGEDPRDDDDPARLGDDASNFRWNPKHINKGVENDLTKFSRGRNSGPRRIQQPAEGGKDGNLKDVIEDDYLEDQLYAILPAESGTSTLVNDKRYDIKKPGPTYMIHEDEDGDTSHDDVDMAEQEARALMAQLSKSARKQQWLGVLKTPVVAQKSATLVVPSREVIEAAQRIVVTGGNDLPQEAEIESARGVEASPDRPAADQPELLEGISDGRGLPDEARMANAAQTGEGHLGRFDTVDATHAYLLIREKGKTKEDAEKLTDTLGSILNLPKGSFSNVRIDGQQITFKVNPNRQNLNASDVAEKAEDYYTRLKELTGITVEAAGIGDKVKYEVVSPRKDRLLFVLTFALCGAVTGVLLGVAGYYLLRRHSRIREKLRSVARPDTEASLDYQDLCRQRMASKTNDKPENIHSTVHSPKKIRSLSQEGQVSSSSHSSTSSWNEEPVTSNMDITTGHIILAYMEDHLKNKDRLDREWEGLCAYEAELCSTAAAALPQNIKKNRYTDVLPYDHSRVILTEASNVASCDYINASSITDHDPRNPAYIATQGPLPHTAADFWQMIWEQGSVVIVMLSRLMENGVAMCHRYWPEEGSEVYHIYEVHLVSEHIWCDDYLVRSFYLKNLRTNETRTVTQFHFMSWPDNGVPSSTRALLEFRRKVNKSYRGRSCPIVVHCSDGIGRTGTYCLIDMVLNRMAKGAKEIDIAATLEHVRDQRAGMVKTKAQFEFVLMAIAEEVHAILKALSQ